MTQTLPDTLNDPTLDDPWLARSRETVARIDLAPEAETVGRVERVGDGIALVSGLPDACLSELLRFDGGRMGFALTLDTDTIGAVLLDDGEAIEAGSRVTGTGEVVRVPVGPGLLGRIVDPLGRPLDRDEPVKAEAQMPVERPAPAIIERDREQARERQRLRRTQTLLGATAALLVVALLAGSVALVQRSRADDQRSQAVAARDRADIDRMVAQSRADARFAPNRAMLLAVEAYDRSPSWKTAGAIEAVLAQQPIGVLAYLAGDGPFGPLDYGKSVIVGRDGATVAVWSAADFRRLRTISDRGYEEQNPVARFQKEFFRARERWITKRFSRLTSA